MKSFRLLCLCPTYGRPVHIVENAIQCFLTQSNKDASLLILDDLGNFKECSGPGWHLFSSQERSPSLPDKYDRMMNIAENIGIQWDGVCVWDDDDVYMFHHLEVVKRCFLLGHNVVKPSTVLSTYAGFNEESGEGRFHGSLSVSKKVIDQLGGWIKTDDRLFDQMMINQSIQAAGGSGDPCRLGPPSYVFRWADTGASHSQHVMTDDKSVTWYNHVRTDNDAKVERNLQGKFDQSTIGIYGEFNRRYGDAVRTMMTG